MPNIDQATSVDLSNYTAAEKSVPVNAPTPSMDYQPGRSTMLRCPFPPISQASPDSLRSYYLRGQVPQFRVMTPGSTMASSSGGTSSGTVIETINSTTTGGSTTIIPLTPQVTTTTAVLAPNQNFVGSVPIAESFQLLSATVGSPCRVRLYGTSLAQLGDLSRGLDIPPAAGSTQNIICDVALDTAPYRWSFQNRLGANADASQSTLIYATLTNLAPASASISLSLSYVPLES